MPTDKEFEDLFREQFQGLEETPPANGWNKIRQEIGPRSTGYKWFAVTALFFAMSLTALVTTLRQENKRHMQTPEVKSLLAKTPETNPVKEKAAFVAQVKATTEKTVVTRAPAIVTNATFSAPKATVSKVNFAKTAGSRKPQINSPIAGTLEMQDKNTATAKEAAASPAKVNTPATYLLKEEPVATQKQAVANEAEVEATTGTIAAPAETEALTDTMGPGPMIQGVPVDRNKYGAPKKGLFRKK